MSLPASSFKSAAVDTAAPISCWVFDLDGTLSDPAPGMLNAFNTALSDGGYPLLEHDAVGLYIGPPLEHTLALLTGNDEPAHIDQLVDSYRGYYRAHGFAENTLYPNILSTLESLRESGARLGVCTSKPASMARRILGHFGIEDFFSFVSGGDVGVVKGQQLAELLHSEQIDAQALMIGDRKFDLIAARDVGLRSCAVCWGYGSTAEINAENPSFCIEHPHALLSLQA